MLQISERELLTASEDTQTKLVEKQAQKYTRLTNICRYGLLGMFSIALVTCFIVNLAVSHTLSWFFIVLASILLATSLILLPAFLHKNKAILTLLASTVSLILLLLVCNIYTGGNWFFIASYSSLFGISIVFLPFVLKSVLHTQLLQNHKSLFYFSINSALLYGLLAICNAYVHGHWFWREAVPIATLSLALPWAMMLIIRYTKINGFFKTSACLALSSLYYVFTENFINRLYNINTQQISFAFNFSDWSTSTMINNNVNAIILFSLIFLVLCFAVAGIFLELKRQTKPSNHL